MILIVSCNKEMLFHNGESPGNFQNEYLLARKRESKGGITQPLAEAVMSGPLTTFVELSFLS